MSGRLITKTVRKRFVVRTLVRSWLRTKVRTTNLTYCGQSTGHDITDRVLISPI